MSHDEEAIKWLECLMQGCDDIRVIDALRTGKNAIEKQIAKKVQRVPSKTALYDEIYCPVCNKYYGDKMRDYPYLFWTPDHCECGQALDWSCMSM